MMKHIFNSILILGIPALFVWIAYVPKNFTTYVQFKQTYASGFSDSAMAVIDTKDSAMFQVLYHSPERKFPTGAYYLSCTSNGAPANRFYLNPSVIRVTPYRVFSVRK